MNCDFRHSHVQLFIGICDVVWLADFVWAFGVEGIKNEVIFLTYSWCIELKISDTMGAPEVYSFITVFEKFCPKIT